MKLSGWRSLAGLSLMLVWFLGCGLPPAAAEAPLTVAAARDTLDGWNPNYCKVAEFHGLYRPNPAGTSQVAYVNLASPGDKVYAASFQLLTRPDGRQQWFLTSLVTHGSGILTKRQGWDNLMIPVKEVGSKQ